MYIIFRTTRSCRVVGGGCFNSENARAACITGRVDTSVSLNAPAGIVSKRNRSGKLFAENYPFGFIYSRK